MTIDERREIMVKYLNLKIYEKDWHGVADAAMDLRDLESEALHTSAGRVIYVTPEEFAKRGI